MSPESSTAADGVATDAKVTPEHLRAKFGELQMEVDTTTGAAKNTAVTIAAGIAVVVVLSVFALGLRRGKKRTTVVEVRRVSSATATQ